MKNKLPKQIAPVASIFSSVLAIVCPLCIPALGALLASLGLGFALKFEVIRGMLIFFLVAAVASLAGSLRSHRKKRIFLLGLAGAVLIYAGRHIWFSVPLMWAGVVMLVGASLWNLWAKSECNQCKDGNSKMILQSVIKCPHCGHEAEEEMPIDRCLFFYPCKNCKATLRPKKGDCCVFCSYAIVKCPSQQL